MVGSGGSIDGTCCELGEVLWQGSDLVGVTECGVPKDGFGNYLTMLEASALIVWVKPLLERALNEVQGLEIWSGKVG